MTSGSDEKPQSVIGYNVTVLTKNGESHKGTVWNEDKQAGLTILHSPAASGTPGLHSVVMLKNSHIAEITGAQPPEIPLDASLPKVDVEKIERREARAVERMERQIRARGVGVTERAQQLFDNLSKTMPCAWVGQTIEVFESVHICPPYATANCAFKDGSEPNDTVMERVTFALTEELKKLDAEEGSAAGAPAQPASNGAAKGAAPTDTAAAQ